jgi:hypothetical protein
MTLAKTTQVWQRLKLSMLGGLENPVRFRVGLTHGADAVIAP